MTKISSTTANINLITTISFSFQKFIQDSGDDDDDDDGGDDSGEGGVSQLLTRRMKTQEEKVRTEKVSNWTVKLRPGHNMTLNFLITCLFYFIYTIRYI